MTALMSSARSLCWTLGGRQSIPGPEEPAPILTQPDTKLQFVVEVDASDVRVGAILSQRSSADGKLHPCAFLSRCLSTAERNYDVGNRELLAVKLALEESCHWLEGAEQPFIVWTDHKNLVYVQSPDVSTLIMPVGPYFFGRFNISVTYRPGSWNDKADDSSRVFSKTE